LGTFPKPGGAEAPGVEFFDATETIRFLTLRGDGSYEDVFISSYEPFFHVAVVFFSRTAAFSFFASQANLAELSIAVNHDFRVAVFDLHSVNFHNQFFGRFVAIVG